MNYSELIDDFLDQTLPAAQEEALFQALAGDEDLRFELKSSLQMRKTILTDTEAFVPPATSVNRLFTQLGYTAPVVGGAGAATVAGLKNGLVKFVGTYSSMIVSAVVGAIITAGVFVAVDAGGPSATTSTELASNPGTVVSAEDSTEETRTDLSTPPVESDGVSDAGLSTARVPNTDREKITSAPAARGQSSRNPVSETRRNTRVMADDEQITNEPDMHSFESDDHATLAEQRKEAEENISKQESSALAILAPSDLLSPSSNVISRDHFERQCVSAIATDFRIQLPAVMMDTNNTLELRSLVMYSFPEPAVNSGGNNGIEDVVLSYQRWFSEDQAVILELGREGFYQEFVENKIDGREFLHRQNPIMMWIGVGYRRRLFSLGPVDPYAQIVLGGAEGGWLGRLMLGAEYRLSDNVRATLGLEGAALLYRFENEFHDARKFGFSYGISYRF